MGIGPGPIKAWRQGVKSKKQSDIPVNKPKKSSMAQAHHAKATSPHTTKSAKISVREGASSPLPPSRRSKLAKPTPDLQPAFKTVEERTRVALKLPTSQIATLTRMFEAPRALAALLREHSGKISTPAEASLFLLKNRKQLDGFINPRARSDSVDLLTELLIQWSDNPPDVIGIDFNDDCSISASQEIYLPIEGFRCLAVADPADLANQRIGTAYATPFTLFEHENGFSVAFNLSRRIQVKSGTVKLPPSTKLKNWRTPEIKLHSNQTSPDVKGMQRNGREPKQRMSYTRFASVFGSGFQSMNWENLSGRGVSGGLPSLGKRSR